MEGEDRAREGALDRPGRARSFRTGRPTRGRPAGASWRAAVAVTRPAGVGVGTSGRGTARLPTGTRRAVIGAHSGRGGRTRAEMLEHD